MSGYFKRILQSALLIWTTLVCEIVAVSVLYISLNAIGTSRNTSLLIAFFALVGLIIAGLFLFPRSIPTLRGETRASVLPWLFRIQVLKMHVNQKLMLHASHRQMSASTHSSMSQSNSVEAVVTSRYSDSKNISIVMVEVLLSLFLGIYGVGWLRIGKTTTGIVLLVCSFTIYWPVMILSIILIDGLDLPYLGPLAIGAIVLNAILLNSTLVRRTSHKASPNFRIEK